MSINVTGLMQCLKHVVPVMREQRGGSCDPSLSPSHQALGCDDQMTSGRRITSISSVAATSGSPRPSMVTYKVSKAAMNTLMEAVAIENARHAIRANGETDAFPALLSKAGTAPNADGWRALVWRQ
eukprot:COSAG04_NODE_1107_length_8233_cov_2.467478_3_plen_126_part_00